MNLDEFSTVVDDRRYIKPQVALDESNAFIEALRNTQGQRTAEIAQDTYNLGTAVPSNLGGLGGSGSYFTSRYQTPQTNEVVANLRATAQAQALNDAMNNALAQAKQRYNNAYKAARRRGGSGGGGGGGLGSPTNPTNPTTGGVVSEDTTRGGSIWDDAAWSEDSVTYGLFKLNRNKGESDSQWNYRSTKWLAEQRAKNAFRGNGGLMSSGGSSATAAGNTSTNNASTSKNRNNMSGVTAYGLR